MTERETREDFGRWVEPHLTVLARYAARQVGSADRDAIVEESLIRAWQRRASYDGSRSAEVWLLEIVGEVCRHPRTLRSPGAVVDLVDEAVVVRASPAVDLEQELDGLEPRQRLLVDLHYYVGLDVGTVAEVLHCEATQVATPLMEVRATLGRVTGEDDARVDQRLAALARRWQGNQPPPPPVPLDRLDTPLPRRPGPRAIVAAAAGLVLVAAGVYAVLRPSSHDDVAAPPRAAAARPQPERRREIVPWRNLAPHNPSYQHDATGAVVTPYDDVSATGDISGTLHPGDTLVFEAALTSDLIVSMHPCPDYTITFGEHTVRRRLNCQQVPYFANIAGPQDKVSAFRPVLPAGVAVFFRMAVVVPDEVGRQEVSWALDGPTQKPAFSGVVEVTDAG